MGIHSAVQDIVYLIVRLVLVRYGDGLQIRPGLQCPGIAVNEGECTNHTADIFTDGDGSQFITGSKRVFVQYFHTIGNHECFDVFIAESICHHHIHRIVGTLMGDLAGDHEVLAETAIGESPGIGLTIVQIVINAIYVDQFDVLIIGGFRVTRYGNGTECSDLKRRYRQQHDQFLI